MSHRRKWVGFRLLRDDGKFYEIELNDKGQLLEPPPRLPRRRTPYSEERSIEYPLPRVARLIGNPSVTLDDILPERKSPFGFGELEEDNDLLNNFEEANPGPYNGSLDESFSNDSFSFGYEDEYGNFDPFIFGF
jgi:hypothetical protein